MSVGVGDKSYSCLSSGGKSHRNEQDTINRTKQVILNFNLKGENQLLWNI